MAFKPVSSRRRTVFAWNEYSEAKVLAVGPYQGKIIPRESFASFQKSVDIGFLLQAGSPGHAQLVRFIKPSDTDAAIVQNDAVHVVYYLDEAQHLDRLLVFLPGTGGTPFFYQRILNQAAQSAP